MRGTMLAVMLLVALIIGILVVKDMNTKDKTGTTNVERIDRAKQAAALATKTINKIKDAATKAAQEESGQSTQ